MTERIRELAWQAGFGKDKNEIYTSKLEHLPITDEIEKFAELIVQECISAAEEAQADFYVINNIKTRFGVEE